MIAGIIVILNLAYTVVSRKRICAMESIKTPIFFWTLEECLPTLSLSEINCIFNLTENEHYTQIKFVKTDLLLQ